MRICILTPYAEPEKGACVIRVDSFAEHFKEKGHFVQVLAPRRAAAGNVMGIKRYSGLLEMMEIIYGGKFDAVLGTSPPMTHNFFALLAARASGAKFIIDAKDPFTYMYTHGGKTMGPKAFLYSLLEKITLENPDFVLTLNPYNMRKILENYIVAGEKITVAMNGTDTKAVKRDAKAGLAIRKRLGLGQGQKVLIYSGCLGGKDLGGFAEAIGKSGFAEKHDIALIFMLTFDGTEHAAAEFERFGAKLVETGLKERSRIVRNVSYEEVGKYFSAADVGVNSMEGYDTYCFPVKVMDYLAAGLPVASKSPGGNEDLNSFIDSHKVGFHASDWAGFAEKLRQLLENPSLMKRFSANATKAANELSREKTSEKVLRIILEICGNKN
ncbi:D-inositol-3-phosphate glycosyltransferase [uncultured archaeon]|nr:D-inositol-3-phosphate glycosyltransferase [uncultured archaeon]